MGFIPLQWKTFEARERKVPDDVEHIDEDFTTIYNIAHEYYQSLKEED
jgi:hypothetical protein